MDISNIYNLKETIFRQYQINPFPENESRPGMQEFARRLKTEIITLPTPYVMVLEGGYGVGKTYFITRFSEYLKQPRFEGDTIVNTVYINLWNNDYVANPFPVIVSQILYYLTPEKKLQDSITQKAIQITNNLIKFGAKHYCGLEIGDVLPNPKQDKDNLDNFKSLLSKLVNKNGGKIVLIVDEIDRCRPDYAVKALETIKHFFDIDGIFIILATNIEFMNGICEAYYGHPNCQVNMGEGYMQKFIQSKRALIASTEEDYLFISKKILNENSLPVMKTLQAGFPVDERTNVQAVDSFIKFMASVFYRSNLSIRKTEYICKELIGVINRNTELIWKNKVASFPEHIIVKHLKAQGLIPITIDEPVFKRGISPHAYNCMQIDDTLNKII